MAKRTSGTSERLSDEDVLTAPRRTKLLPRRQLEKVPAEIQAISWKAQVRLCKRGIGS